MIIKNKKAFEMSFSWIFAIIAGAFILFIAVYAAIQFTNLGTTEVNARVAKQISILFQPLEIGLEEGGITYIDLKKHTTFFNDPRECKTTGEFGRQRIGASSEILDINDLRLRGRDILISVYNKYVFSKEVEQGRILYVFIKPFKMPFKVSDLIMTYSDNYCFLNPPDKIQEEIDLLIGGNLESANINIVNSLSECASESEKVCFSNFQDKGCDIFVAGDCFYPDCENIFDSGSVTKQGKTVYFSGNLIYAAIFSNPDLYECNVKRLMKRLAKIALIYKDESIFISNICQTGLELELVELANAADSYENSNNLYLVEIQAEKLKEKNMGLNCKLYIE